MTSRGKGDTTSPRNGASYSTSVSPSSSRRVGILVLIALRRYHLHVLQKNTGAESHRRCGMGVPTMETLVVEADAETATWLERGCKGWRR